MKLRFCIWSKPLFQAPCFCIFISDILVRMSKEKYNFNFLIHSSKKFFENLVIKQKEETNQSDMKVVLDWFIYNINIGSKTYIKI